MYFIVTVVRFVIILIVFLCMYGNNVVNRISVGELLATFNFVKNC